VGAGGADPLPMRVKKPNTSGLAKGRAEKKGRYLPQTPGGDEAMPGFFRKGRASGRTRGRKKTKKSEASREGDLSSGPTLGKRKKLLAYLKKQRCRGKPDQLRLIHKGGGKNIS